MAMSTVHITKRKGVVGGKPAVAGTRIKVSHIVLRYLGSGDSVAEIVRRYTHLTPAQVHSALAYFYEHPEEILTELFEELEQIRARLSPDELQRLRNQLATIALEGLRFTDWCESAAQAQDAPGVYCALSAVSKSEHAPVAVAAAESVRKAIETSPTAGHRYAVRYAPIEESQRIASLLQYWLQLP